MRWQVTNCEGRETNVTASNWMVALGAALNQFGCPPVRRLAAEVFPSGRVLARDVENGVAWTLCETSSWRSSLSPV